MFARVISIYENEDDSGIASHFCFVFVFNQVFTEADVKNPARGHKVEKHNPEGKNVRRTLHTKRKR